MSFRIFTPKNLHISKKSSYFATDFARIGLFLNKTTNRRKEGNENNNHKKYVRL